MAKIIKNKPVTEAEFNKALKEHQNAHNKEALLCVRMEERLAKVRESYADELGVLAKTKEETLATAQRYCEAHEEDLFTEKRSIVTPYGTAGFQKGKPAVVLAEGKDWETVLAVLQKRLPDYVRKVPTVDKAKIIANREDAKLASRMESIGISVQQGETFYFKPKAEKKDKVAVPA